MNARRELGEVGAGLQLGPNAVKVLRALGIEDALRRSPSSRRTIVSLAWDDAHLRFREPLKGVMPRADSARPISRRIVPTCTGCCCARCPRTACASMHTASAYRRARAPRSRRSPTGARSRPTSSSAPTGSTRRCARACSVRSPPATRSRWRGAASCRSMRADARRPGRPVAVGTRRVCRLDRARRPRDLLSDPRRRALQHLRRARVGGLGR